MDDTEIIKSTLFTQWQKKFNKSGCKIESLLFYAAVKKNSFTYRSIYFECSYITPEEQKQTRSILLRGPSVAIIPVVMIENSRYFLVVKQRRIINGEYSIEFPAGAAETPDFESEKEMTQAAARELNEETGLSLEASRFELLAKDLVVCPSAFDETATWFVVNIQQNEINNIKEISGNADDGEHTIAEVISESKLLEHPTFQILTGISLLEGRKNNTKIK